MKKEFILKKNRDFNNIINNGKVVRSRNFVIYYTKSTEENPKFGFSVGKKIGNAVTRNKVKRQLKNILNKEKYTKNIQCVIITKKGILNLNYIEIQMELLTLLKKAGIII